jgi:hypothetical protein
MLVYCAHESPRVKYVLDEILVRRLGIKYKTTDNADYFEKTSSNRINYSNTIFANCINIPASNLLYEEDIRIFEPEIKQDEDWFYMMFTFNWEVPHDLPQPTQLLPFDLFSSFFYFISRYEEYQPNVKRDEHGRYKAENSLAYRCGFLHMPLLDSWVDLFKQQLRLQYSSIQFKENNFKQISTIDIDFAFKFLGLSTSARFRKTIGTLVKGKFSDFTKALYGVEKDPYDTYQMILQKSKDSGIENRFFFLLADRGGFDKNISMKAVEMRNLSKYLLTQAICGIHPSYASSLNRKLLKEEKELFFELFGVYPKTSRQHFLKIRLPETYRNLADMGISEDYTMAYSEAPGFRASTSYPFQFFDLSTQEVLPITIYSSCLMDVGLKNYSKLTPENAIQMIQHFKRETMRVNGYFISIWHNSSFDEDEGWANWKEVFDSLYENVELEIE